jgi:hypothetical protein
MTTISGTQDCPIVNGIKEVKVETALGSHLTEKTLGDILSLLPHPFLHPAWSWTRPDLVH